MRLAQDKVLILDNLPKVEPKCHLREALVPEQIPKRGK